MASFRPVGYSGMVGSADAEASWVVDPPPAAASAPIPRVVLAALLGLVVYFAARSLR